MSAFESSNAADNVLASGTGAALLTPDDFEDDQIAELEDCDDWASAWQDCKELGIKWGGRGAGGRAAGRMTVQSYDVVVEGCTMAYLGTNLLDRTTLRLLQGKKYGLIGRNGVGKSTLMRRIASGTLPGFPPHLRVSQVRQELPYLSPDQANITPVEYVVNFNPVRRMLLKKINQMENGEVDSEDDEEDPEAVADILCELYDLLEDEGIATGRAVNVLKDLGFTEKRRSMPMNNMSGGWKMRTSIACALAQQPDILLLDEPTNHLDMEGVEWLKSYVNGPSASELTMLITSHDSNFLDDVCTDIIRFFQQKLHYYVGNYTEFQSIKHDKDLMDTRSQDKINKQRKHIEDQIQRMQVSAHKDASGKGSGAVASRKKKLARHGAEKNEKGFRFRVQQDSYKGMSSIRAGAQNEVALGGKTGHSRCLIEACEREWSMTLPNPVPLGSRAPIIQIKNATLGFAIVADGDNNAGRSSGATPVSVPVTSISSSSTSEPAAVTSVSHMKSLGSKSIQKKAVSSEDTVLPATTILESITLDIEQNTKVGIVGKNGCGKSTLLKTITQYGEGKPAVAGSPIVIKGDLYKHPSLRIAYYQQLQQECLPYELSPIQHLTNVAPPDSHNEQTLRAHLGAFGLSGDLALQQIGALSGGQKSRVVFAELTLCKPHLLLLDEPTNNLDLDAIRALKDAVNAYQGACIITSHDMAFVSGCAEVVYHIDKGKMRRLEAGVEDYKAHVRDVVAKQKKIK